MLALEIMQWLAILVLGVLVLGLYRQLSVYLGSPAAGSLEALTGPRLRRKVPNPMLEALRGLPGVSSTKPSLLLVVSENCRGCQRLLGGLMGTEDGRLLRENEQMNVVLVPDLGSEGFLRSLSETGLPVLTSSQHSWPTQIDVAATPFTVVLNQQGLVVGKGIYDDVRQIVTDFLGERELL